MLFPKVKKRRRKLACSGRQIEGSETLIYQMIDGESLSNCVYAFILTKFTGLWPPPFPQLTKAVTACRQISLTPLSLNFFLLFKKYQAQISNVRELSNVRLRMFDLATNTSALVSKKREITSKHSGETDGVFIDQHLDAVWKSSITVDSRCRL